MASHRYSAENPPQELVDEIRSRLGGVCAGWPPDVFARMTARAAWIEFKYDRAMTDSFAAARLQEIREAEGTRPAHR